MSAGQEEQTVDFALLSHTYPNAGKGNDDGHFLKQPHRHLPCPGPIRLQPHRPANEEQVVTVLSQQRDPFPGDGGASPPNYGRIAL